MNRLMYGVLLGFMSIGMYVSAGSFAINQKGELHQEQPEAHVQAEQKAAKYITMYEENINKLHSLIAKYKEYLSSGIHNQAKVNSLFEQSVEIRDSVFEVQDQLDEYKGQLSSKTQDIIASLEQEAKRLRNIVTNLESQEDQGYNVMSGIQDVSFEAGLQNINDQIIDMNEQLQKIEIFIEAEIYHEYIDELTLYYNAIVLNAYHQLHTSFKKGITITQEAATRKFQELAVQNNVNISLLHELEKKVDSILHKKELQGLQVQVDKLKEDIKKSSAKIQKLIRV